MTLLRNLPVAGKLGLGFGVLAMLMALLGLQSYRALGDSSALEHDSDRPDQGRRGPARLERFNLPGRARAVPGAPGAHGPAVRPAPRGRAHTARRGDRRRPR